MPRAKNFPKTTSPGIPDFLFFTHPIKPGYSPVTVIASENEPVSPVSIDTDESLDEENQRTTSKHPNRPSQGRYARRVFLLESSDLSGPNIDSRRQVRSWIRQSSHKKIKKSTSKRITSKDNDLADIEYGLSQDKLTTEPELEADIDQEAVLAFLEKPTDWRPLLLSAWLLFLALGLLVSARLYEELGHAGGVFIFAIFFAVVFGPPLFRFLSLNVIMILARVDTFLVELREKHGEVQDSDCEDSASNDHVISVDELSNISDRTGDKKDFQLVKKAEIHTKSKKSKTKPSKHSVEKTDAFK